MSDKSTIDKIQDAAVITGICAYLLGSIGFAIHSVLILPIKYIIWSNSDLRTHPDNVLRHSVITYLLIGMMVFIVPIYVSSCVVTNEFHFEWFHHMIFIGLMMIPMKHIVVGIYNEFAVLFEQVGEKYEVIADITFSVLWRFIVGFVIIVALAYAAYDITINDGWY